MLLALAGLSSAAQATSTSFSGNFSTDDQLVTILIDLPVVGDISALTLSYGGGTNAAGQVIPAGGFAPVLNLFDGTGNNVQTDAGSSHTCPGAGGSFCWDAFLSYPGAAAGHCTLMLSQDGNDSLGQLSDSFSMTGQPNYTGQCIGSSSATFVQIDGAQRTGRWALDVSVPNGASVVPEPDAATLLVAGLATVGLARRRQRG